MNGLYLVLISLVRINLQIISLPTWNVKFRQSFQICQSSVLKYWPRGRLWVELLFIFSSFYQVRRKLATNILIPPIYLPTLLLTYQPIYLLFYLPNHLPTYASTYLRFYLPTLLPTYLPIYQPSHLSTYPSTYLPSIKMKTSTTCLITRRTKRIFHTRPLFDWRLWRRG